MRAWLTLSLVVACGPIYKDPPAQPQSQQPPAPGQGQYQSGPPGGGADPEQPQPQPQPYNDPPPQPQPQPRPTPAPTPAGKTGAPAAWQSLVATHNAQRAKHCAAPLTWSPKLAQAAQSWADALVAQGCKFGHKPRNPFGENLAGGTTGTLDGVAVADMWYDEVKYYKFPDGGFSGQTGHFTQVVWRETTQIGCGTASCKGLDLFVCEYDPPGNVDTMYRQNVLPSGCR